MFTELPLFLLGSSLLFLFSSFPLEFSSDAQMNFGCQFVFKRGSNLAVIGALAA